MGLANLVPGISGGTMLLAAGVYQAFIESIAEITTLRIRVRPLVLGSKDHCVLPPGHHCNHQMLVVGAIVGSMPHQHKLAHYLARSRHSGYRWRSCLCHRLHS